MRKRSALICTAEPTRATRKWTVSGLALAAATYSCTVLKPSRRRDDHHVRHAADRAHGHEVAHDVVGELRIERRRDGVRRGMHQHRVAVRLGLGDHRRAERAARAGAILHHDALPELRRHLLKNDARHDIDGAAWPERNDGADRLRRPGLAEALAMKPATRAVAARSMRRTMKSSVGSEDHQARAMPVRAGGSLLRSARCRRWRPPWSISRCLRRRASENPRRWSALPRRRSS